MLVVSKRSATRLNFHVDLRNVCIRTNVVVVIFSREFFGFEVKLDAETLKKWTFEVVPFDFHKNRTKFKECFKMPGRERRELTR